MKAMNKVDLDYIAFSFMGVHTSELNIIRVSGGDRYEDSVTPSFSDKVLEVPGRDGSYYWESNFKNRTFTFNLAFDSMTEANLRRFRQIFNGKSYGELIMEEHPFKKYLVKLQREPSLSYLTFMSQGQRVFKGEGTVSFVAHSPYAKSVYKFLDQYSEELYPNKNEWAEGSGMKESQGEYDILGTTIKNYNAGDVDADVVFYYEIDKIINKDLRIENGNNGLKILLKSPKHESDKYIKIDSQSHLIEGLDSDKKRTGSLYGDIIQAGDFFKLPLGESITSTNIKPEGMEYDYLYY